MVVRTAPLFQELLPTTGLYMRDTTTGGNVALVDMRRWTTRVLVGLCSLIVVTALTGAAYQSVATRRDLPFLRLPDSSSTSEGTGCICGAQGTARLP